MKKFTKIILIMAAVCFLVGTVITAAAATLGGHIPSEVGYHGRKVKTQLERLEEDIVVKPQVTTEALPGLGDMGDIASTDEAVGVVREVEIQVKAGCIEIVQGETDGAIEVRGLSDYIELKKKADHDSLELVFQKKKGADLSLAELPHAVVVLPAGYDFEEIKLEVKAGSLTMDSVTARKMELEAGAGGIEVTNGIADDLEIKCQAGGVEYAGDVTERLEAECGVGGIELYLKGAETDFNYDLEMNLGSIEINGKNYSQDKKRILQNDGAVKEAELECSMGSISLDFEE